jgi:hypothetical protein
VEEGTGSVTLCVVIWSGEHFRAFNISVYTFNNTADSNDFEAISGQLLLFTTLDSEQCFNVSITDDSECEYNEEICEDEVFKCVLETEEGSRVMAVDPFTSVYIQDRDDCEGLNTSCTPSQMGHNIIKSSVPNVIMTPSQTVILMDEPMGSTTTPVWAVVSVVGLVIFLAILLVISVILIVRKKTKKQRLTKFAKSSEEDDFDMPTRYISIDVTRRSSIDELQKTLPRNMIFSSYQIRLSNTVGQGKELECPNPHHVK